MRDYRPSNLLAPQGIIFLIVAVAVGGVAIGLITYFVSTLIYLIIIFPLIIGAAAGGVIAAAVHLGKVRSPMGAALFGLLITIVLYGTYRYAEYELGFKDDIRESYFETFRDELATSGFTAAADEVAQVLDEALGDDTAADYELREATGSTGFGAFIKYSADLGVTFNSSRSPSSSGFTLKGTAAYIYWLIEFVVMAGIAATIAASMASSPFSEETKEWYGKDEYVATLQSGSVIQFYEYLKQSNFRAAGQLIAASSTNPPRVDVMVKRVNSPAADLVLVIKQLTPKKNRVDTKDLHTGLLTTSEFSQLQSTMQGTGNPAL